MSDYTFENHGSLFLCRANNDAAFEWLQEHVGDEAQWWGHSVAVEPRYVVKLAKHLQDDGYTVE